MLPVIKNKATPFQTVSYLQFSCKYNPFYTYQCVTGNLYGGRVKPWGLFAINIRKVLNHIVIEFTRVKQTHVVTGSENTGFMTRSRGGL